MQIRDYLKEEEEGRVGTINGLTVSVHYEPLKNPSFRIRTDTFDRHCVYQIKDFDLLEQKTKEGFSNKEPKIVFEWLNKKSKADPDLTNWQILLIEWNLQNENSRISTKLTQPEF